MPDQAQVVCVCVCGLAQIILAQNFVQAVLELANPPLSASPVSGSQTGAGLSLVLFPRLLDLLVILSSSLRVLCLSPGSLGRSAFSLPLLYMVLILLVLGERS